MPVKVEPASAPMPATEWEIVTARGHVLRSHGPAAATDIAVVLAALEFAVGSR